MDTNDNQILLHSFPSHCLPKKFIIYLNYLLEQTIEGLGVTVPKGLRIYGTIKVFFFEAHADVTITYENPKDFDITIIVKISPINWFNGLIQISKAGDSSKGPHFLLKAKPVSCYMFIIN